MKNEIAKLPVWCLYHEHGYCEWRGSFKDYQVSIYTLLTLWYSDLLQEHTSTCHCRTDRYKEGSCFNSEQVSSIFIDTILIIIILL